MLKKITALFCVCILTISALSSYSKTSSEYHKVKINKTVPNYGISVTGYSDGLDLEGLKIEYEMQTKSFDGYVPQKQVEITIGDRKIIGKTTGEPEYKANQYYPVYTYHVSETKEQFRTDPYRNVVYYNNKDAWCYEAEPKLPEEDYERMALEFLEKLNISGCKVLSTKQNQSGKEYMVYFAQYVGSMKTSGYGELMIKYDGQVSYYYSHMINQIPKDVKNPFDMDLVAEKVEAYVAEKTKTKRGKYDDFECTYDYQLTVLADGTLAILCTADMHFISYYQEEIMREGKRLDLIVR